LQVLRTPASDHPLVVTDVMGEDGGYYLSTTVCQSSKEFEAVSGWLELAKPEHARARSEALWYLTSVQQNNR
jgi:hypothetical protein